MDRCPKNDLTAKSLVCKKSSSHLREKLEKPVEEVASSSPPLAIGELIKLDHTYITAGLLNQKPTKKVMLLY